MQYPENPDMVDYGPDLITSYDSTFAFLAHAVNGLFVVTLMKLLSSKTKDVFSTIKTLLL